MLLRFVQYLRVKIDYRATELVLRQLFDNEVIDSYALWLNSTDTRHSSVKQLSHVTRLIAVKHDDWFTFEHSVVVWLRCLSELDWHACTAVSVTVWACGSPTAVWSLLTLYTLVWSAVFRVVSRTCTAAVLRRRQWMVALINYLNHLQHTWVFQHYTLIIRLVRPLYC